MEGELYSAREVARILELKESRVLYWSRTGVVGPSVKRGGKLLFTFADLITVKVAKQLIEQGLSLQTVRKNVAALRSALPEVDRPLTQLRVVSDGERLVVADAAGPFEPLSGQLVIDFTVGALSHLAAELSDLSERPAAPEAPAAVERTSYGWFLAGCAAEDLDPRSAESAYRRALALDPALAAAHTNLGNLAHGGGRAAEAREHYRQALAIDPEQPEARFNLGNLLDELGEAEAARAEWTRVAAFAPAWADAHFNLGAALARDGEPRAAAHHLTRYLALEKEGEWADEARRLLGEVSASDNQ